MSTPRSTRSGSDETGAGLIATTTGVLCFLVLLLVAVQVLFNLYATSAVEAAAFDAARIAAGAASERSTPADLATTEQVAAEHVRRVLGRFGAHQVRAVELAVDGDDIALTVRAENPSFLPRLLNAGFAMGRVEMTIRVRAEREQP